MSKHLTYAILFDNVMRALWGDEADNDDDFIVRALVDKIRAAHINPENALDVLDQFGEGYARIIAVNCDRVTELIDESRRDIVAIFTVLWVDNSSNLIIARRGIGSGVEVL